MSSLASVSASWSSHTTNLTSPSKSLSSYLSSPFLFCLVCYDKMSSPPRSPKRNGLILEEQQFVYDEENWPLRSEVPSLTMSPTCSEESLMPATPPNEPNESILLPGFHFSTTD